MLLFGVLHGSYLITCIAFREAVQNSLMANSYELNMSLKVKKSTAVTGDYCAKIDVKPSETLPSTTEHSNLEMLIPAEQSDVAVPFGGVTNAKAVLLKVSSKVKVKVTGGSTPNLIPVASAILLTADSDDPITAITITTPSGLAADCGIGGG